MNKLNDTSVVKQQYATSNNLNTRISIHDKYSTNKMGFGNWIVSNYKIEKGMRVLELGCGTGDMWKNRNELIKSCSELILSDFSAGMLETSRCNVGSFDNVEYKVIDIQEIPYEDESFDIVIANMMLYHIPDLDKALSEVRRVLKKCGHFYCATYGEHGILEYLLKMFSEYNIGNAGNKSFTLQNGEKILEKVFSKVEKLEYIDSLEVTNADDMVEYILSLPSMLALTKIPRQTIKDILVQNMEDGILRIPKEYGMFVAS